MLYCAAACDMYMLLCTDFNADESQRNREQLMGLVDPKVAKDPPWGPCLFLFGRGAESC